MGFRNNKKMKLNILLLLVFVLVIVFFSIFFKRVIINSSIENGVAQARQIIKHNQHHLQQCIIHHPGSGHIDYSLL